MDCLETLPNSAMTRPQQQGGFSLIELMVALMVTMAIVALVFAGVSVIGRSTERNQQVMERAQRMLVVGQWLGRKFDTLRLLVRQEDSRLVNFFMGNAAGALWVAPLPEQGHAGGLYVLRATPERHANGQVDLAIEVLPYNGFATQLDWQQARRATLLTDVQTLQWFYQDGATGEWTQQWDASQRRFPARVRIELADAQGAWPPLIFALSRAR